MPKLETVDAVELRSALESAETAKAAKRLMVALAYMDGVDVPVLVDRYGIPQSTIYYWLDRFEEHPVAVAVEDEPRPGRPPKLDPDQREVVESWLVDESTRPDGDATRWTAPALQRRIAEEFDVEYSVPHVERTFLRE